MTAIAHKVLEENKKQVQGITHTSHLTCDFIHTQVVLVLPLVKNKKR